MSSTRSGRVPPLSARPVEARRSPRWARASVTSLLPRLGPRTLAQAVLVLVAAGAVAAGVLGLRADRDGHEDAVIGEVVGIPGGEMRVDKVTYWDESQHMRGMPGMTISDPLPEGYRRFWVDVTMHASSEPGLRYAPETVAVSAAGLSPVVPHWAPEGLGVIVPGAQATVTFMYQVPETIGDVLLTADGASRPVVIPDADGAAGDDHGH